MLPIDEKAFASLGNPTEPIGPSSIGRFDGLLNLQSAVAANSESNERTGSATGVGGGVGVGVGSEPGGRLF